MTFHKLWQNAEFYEFKKKNKIAFSFTESWEKVTGLLELLASIDRHFMLMQYFNNAYIIGVNIL